MASGEAKEPADSLPSGQDGPASQSKGQDPADSFAIDDAAEDIRPTLPIPAVAHAGDDPPPPGSANMGDEFFSDRPGMEMISGYEIVKEISRGGQGVVYQSIQNSTKRKVAVKVLLEGPYATKSANRHCARHRAGSHPKRPNIVSLSTAASERWPADTGPPGCGIAPGLAIRTIVI